MGTASSSASATTIARRQTIVRRRAAARSNSDGERGLAVDEVGVRGMVVMAPSVRRGSSGLDTRLHALGGTDNWLSDATRGRVGPPDTADAARGRAEARETRPAIFEVLELAAIRSPSVSIQAAEDTAQR